MQEKSEKKTFFIFLDHSEKEELKQGIVKLCSVIWDSLQLVFQAIFIILNFHYLLCKYITHI